MKKFSTFCVFIACVLFTFSANADTTLSRDGEGAKVQGAAFGTLRSASIGTKGFKCFSTVSRSSWTLKVVSASTTDGAGLGFKMFYNGIESAVFDVNDDFFQFQNAPTSKSPTLTSVCMRGYSTPTLKKANAVLQ